MRTAKERKYDQRRTRKPPTSQHLEIFSEWQRGTQASDLATKFGVDKSTVSRLIRRVQSWRNAAECDEVEALRETTIGTLTKLAAEAEAGWERSKNPTVRTKTGKSGENAIDERTETSSSGDPRFLEACVKILDARSRVAGLGGQPLSVSMVSNTLNVGEMPQELVDRLRALSREMRRQPLEAPVSEE